MPNNTAIPFYEDGDELTGYCTAAVVGKTFLAISGNRQVGAPPAGVTDSITGGNISVATCGAGLKVIGVAGYDQVLGGLVPVYRAGRVMPVTAGAALTAGQEVQSDAAGKAILLAAGKPAGICLADCASGADAQISLYP